MAGQSAKGKLLNSASLSLNFMTPGVLDPRITFTRASTATYFDSAGVLRTAAIDAPRWDYDPSTKQLKGLLIEEARTNLTLYSGDVSNAVWQKLAITAAAPAVTANQTTAPDETMTAARVVYPAVSAGGTSILAEPITVAATAYAFSVYLRGSVGGEQLYLSANSGATFLNGGRITLTTAWQRFTLVTGSLTAASWFFIIGTDLRDAGQAATSAQTIYVWGAQLEAGAFPTSYIPTTSAAVTRSADDCKILPANTGWYVPPGGSWFAEFIRLNTTNDRRVISYPVASNRTQLYLGSTSNVGSFDGAGVVNVINATPVNAISKGVTTWAAPNVGRACADGGTIASVNTLTAGFPDMVAWGGVGIMQYGVPGEGVTGYIRRINYWSRVLSDAEMQSVTTL
jgi:hypothetical protein